MFEGKKNVKTSMADIVIWGTDIKSDLETVKKVLDINKPNNLTLIQRKMLNCCNGINILVRPTHIQ